MSENESEEEIKSDVEMKEEKEIMLKDTSLLDQLSTTKYNYDGKEINQTNTNNTLSNPFKTLKDQRVPIEIKLSIRQPGRNAKPITQTYIDCWLTQYSKAVSSSTITITESCTISYSDVI